MSLIPSMRDTFKTFILFALDLAKLRGWCYLIFFGWLLIWSFGVYHFPPK